APGSRSAPLAIALWDRAAGEPGEGGAGVRLHVRIDERCASFLARGLAKASRRPVALVCTSGTAAAHFHAAVIEASEAGVPLLVLTADRPPELRDTGANQAIDQVKLYGDAVRWFCEAGVPEARPGMNAYWRCVAGPGLGGSRRAGGRVPGPGAPDRGAAGAAGARARGRGGRGRRGGRLARAAGRPPGRRAVDPRRRRRRARRSAGPALDRARGDRLR